MGRTCDSLLQHLIRLFFFSFVFGKKTTKQTTDDGHFMTDFKRNRVNIPTNCIGTKGRYRLSN